MGRSWTRFGALPGLFGANSGGFGGRWISADRIDPARIAMYVPKGRYKALHLIAVSDGRKDSVPTVTAQFYRPDAGHPINFAGHVPASGSGSEHASPVSIRFSDGKKAGLHHVVIPLDPDGFSWFTDLNRIGLEITKEVQFYRAYPDPFEYSWHGAGLPSSVQIYAMTLERVGVDLDLQPDPFGHIWTAPTPPTYKMGYGVARFESCNPAYNCANYWGEQHYGGGLNNRLPVATPGLAYVNYATITRHLNRANFTRYIPTGSTSTYCQQFKHYKTGKLIHVLWTIRGKRPVSVKVPPGTTLEIYDQNDNPTALKEEGGMVTFTVDQSPQYLEGLTADAEITLGESDHSDAAFGDESVKLGNLSSWKLVAKEDLEYAKNKPLQIERFLGKMSARKVDAPKAQGGKALAVHLDKQDKDRGVMPVYTTLEPSRQIKIAGKASHLGLWVHAASDWGRVVYFLQDARGEKWISVGTKEEWNNDDIHCWSAFCFDGWRYLRFQMPSNAPYDSYREYGSTWWGSYGGDGVVDLPLNLVKIIIERRPKVIYGADLVPARPDDVLLGDLYAEYAQAADRKRETVRLSKLRMPAPESLPELDNPIADLEKTGVGAPTRTLKVRDPAYQYDGTRCHVDFEPVAGAKTYDVWVSPYADGRGALMLGAGWTESGALIQGLHPETEFYLFIVYTDKDGKASKPSVPFKFVLKNRFVYQ
ncbi:MAG: hypothetical protein O3B01_31705 [Planctomycetota bacterium]|nr:hypothetical protein [Planctomycetota bacterium]